MKVPSILQKYFKPKQREVAAGQTVTSYAELSSRIADCPAVRGFEQQLRHKLAVGPAVIAEVKKASPSAGIIRADFHPAQIAQSYERGGAACLSVLTDRKYFQGSDEYLQQARDACSLPVLRKDFMIDPWQILQSECWGRLYFIDSGGFRTFKAERAFVDKQDTGMDALIEVHNEEEMQLALELDHQLIGVNNRNLNTFETTLTTSERLKKMMPADQILVTESGIKNAADVQRMQNAGINTFLVGEAFMRESEPGQALNRMFF